MHFRPAGHPREVVPRMSTAIGLNRAKRLQSGAVAEAGAAREWSCIIGWLEAQPGAATHKR